MAVRRRFESASRCPGVDLATFATKLGILAVRRFQNMGERIRDLMVRNKFIASQQSRALHWHLDGASVEASIGDIVDSCRVWESHTEAGYGGPDVKFPHTISPGGRGSPITVGVDSIGHVAGEHGTVIADAGIVTSGDDS